jgi:rhodanese-related sulfurtransferase
MNNSTALDDITRGITFEFFGCGQHKIEIEDLLATEDGILLHVRAVPEWESIQLKMKHHINVLWIPTEEIPDRLNEIPRNKTVGIFCTNGPRSAAVYLYLRSKAYEHVRIAPGNYDAITSLLLPGKLFKFLNEHRTAEHDRK